MLIAASLLLLAFAAKAESLASWRGPRHVAPYLYEIWYEDYDFKADSTNFLGEMAASCSSVRKGNFHGRNLDYCLWDTPEFAKILFGQIKVQGFHSAASCRSRPSTSFAATCATSS